IVVEVKRDAMAQIVVNNLFSQTALESTFGVTMLAIDGGVPRLLDLKQLLDRFVSHRREVVTRRTRHDLRKAEERLHIVEGLVVAVNLLDFVVELFLKSAGPDESRWGLLHNLSAAHVEHERFRDLPSLDPGAARAGLARVVAGVRQE